MQREYASGWIISLKNSSSNHMMVRNFGAYLPNLHDVTEQADISVTLWTCMREEFGSNLGRITSYSNYDFSWFSSVHPSKSKDCNSGRSQLLPSKSFKNSVFINHLNFRHSTVWILATL